MPVMKYNPFADAEEVSTGLRLFQDTVSRLLSDPSGARPWTPPVDIVETENELMLTADVPGVSLDNIDIRVENGTLALKGERKAEQSHNGRGYHRIERNYGAFGRYFSLPETVDTEKVRADLKNGVLTVVLPKKEVAKPRSIKVEVSNS